MSVQAGAAAGEAAPGFDLRGFIENSLLEWEDRIAAVVVAGGCNLRCPYCHSWRYVTGLAGLKPLDARVVFDLLERQRGWIDGVVFTGGEPTLQPGLADMIRRVREYDVAVKLHSNGTRPEIVGALLEEGLLDCLALDYKAPLDDRALVLAESRDNIEAMRRAFSLAAASGIEREYHTTLAPAFVTADMLADMGEELEAGGTWFLQQYENGDCLDPVAAGALRFTGAELDRLEAVARERHERVIMKRGTSA